MSVQEVKPHAGGIDSGLLSYVAFDEPVPDRRVVLAWRKSFTRMPAIDAVCDAAQTVQADTPVGARLIVESRAAEGDLDIEELGRCQGPRRPVGIRLGDTFERPHQIAPARGREWLASSSLQSRADIHSVQAR